jgi:arginyl-tRNA--protein-N-Asp/Glu arginylyltransferase
MDYLHWKEETVADLSPENVAKKYADGFVFTRLGRGVMHQTRSVRIDLAKFHLTSENRRILKKGVEIVFEKKTLPLSDYSWTIGKTAKDFYDAKAEPGTFTANKIKELVSLPDNFNTILSYSIGPEKLGYAICYGTSDMLHYSYPFYDLEKSPKDMGLVMMIEAIKNANETGRAYVYLGSLQRPTDTYKLQFEGIEWFDGKSWRTDTEEVKKILTSAKIGE